MIGQNKIWIGWAKETPFPQQACFDRADAEQDTVFAVKQIKYLSSDGEEKQTNTYNSFKDHEEFISYMKSSESNNHYELIKNQCVEYYDFDYKTQAVKEYYKGTVGSVRSKEENIDMLINAFVRNFIKERNEFANLLFESNKLDKDLTPFYFNISIDDCIILEANSEDKFSLHLLVRRTDKKPIFFISPTEQKRIQTEFQKYLTEKTDSAFFKIDLSVYNNNSLFRCKGQTKITGTPRILKPWGSQASQITDDRLFLCSYVENPQGYLSIQLPPENEKVSKYDDIDYEESSKDVIKLVEIIIESVSTKNNKYLCDTEIPDKICYDKWKCLVFAVFKYLSDEECVKIFPSLFQLYRSHKSYSMDNILRGFLQTKGKYDYSIKSLHYWAFCSKQYKTEFKKYHDVKFGKKQKTKEEKLIQACLKGDQKSFSEFFHFLQKEVIKVVEKDDKKFTYYEYDDETRLWLKHKSIDLWAKISNTIVPKLKPMCFTIQEQIKELEQRQQAGITHKENENALNKENVKKQKELDKKYEREMKAHEKANQKNISEFEKEYKAYKKRIEKIQRTTLPNLLEEALRQERLTEPFLRPYDADPPEREVVSITKIEEDEQYININETNKKLKELRFDLDRLNKIVNKDLEKASFLRGVVEFFNSKSTVDEHFIELLKNKPDNLFPFEDKVYDFNTGCARDRVKEDYFDFTTDNKLIKLTEKDRTTIYDYIASLITNSEMSEEDRKEHVESFLTYMAYCLSGDNHLKKILIMKGASGDNGKTCFLNLFKKVIGNFGIEPQKKVFIESKADSVHQTELFDLVDKRVSYISELAEKTKFNIELMKFISGDDGHDGKKSARKCGGLDNAQIKLICKMVIITNEIPKFDGADKAFLERLFVVDFCNRFEKDGEKAKEILGYKDILFSYLCEEGHKFYSIKKKFNMSKQSMITTTKEKKDKDSVLAFMSEKIIITGNHKDRILRGSFLMEYNSFCSISQMENISRNKLYERLKTEFKIDSYNERYFTGVKQVSETNIIDNSDPLGGLNR